MSSRVYSLCYFFFFFNDTATTEIYTLSLHDALPIYVRRDGGSPRGPLGSHGHLFRSEEHTSELQSRFGISYAVFCLKKKQRILGRLRKHRRLYTVCGVLFWRSP